MEACPPGRNELKADGRNVAVVTVRVMDADGRVVPTAGNEIEFSLEGPGRILGVGNGDPSSHELDRYVDSVRIRPLGDWSAPDPADTEKPIQWEAMFDGVGLPGGSTLLLNALGREQTVVLNGGQLMESASREKARTEIPLDSLDIQPTGNRLTITPQPFQDWRDRENTREIRPASLRMVKPAGTWRRRVFSGLAQVIIQTTGDAGQLLLTATSERMKSRDLRMTAK